MITSKDAIKWLSLYADALDENKVYLTKLDADIGDADHGINMTRGFDSVREQLDSLKNEDLGTIFKKTGTALVSSVGGAAGPLYGTWFMEAGKVTSGEQSMDTDQLKEVFQAGLDGIKRRGKAEAGQKTMIDAMKPAVDALERSVEDGDDIESALQSSSEAAYDGMKDTIPMVAEKGRASYLGERSKGHQDPGATSTYLLVNTLYQSFANGTEDLKLKEAKHLSEDDLDEVEPTVEDT